MEPRRYRLSNLILYASVACLCAFGLISIVTAETVPHKSDERFNSQQISGVHIFYVVDPDSKRYDWIKEHEKTFNSALTELLAHKGYEVDAIEPMSYVKARKTLGSTRSFPLKDENYSQWLAALDLQKHISAVIVVYIQFQHYYGGIKVEWLSELSIEYCIISTASGMKLLCSDLHTFINTEKGIRTYGGNAPVIYREKDNVPFTLKPKKNTPSFVKDSIATSFMNLPSKD